jgi:hypothetical protein
MVVLIVEKVITALYHEASPWRKLARKRFPNTLAYLSVRRDTFRAARIVFFARRVQRTNIKRTIKP